MDRLPITTCAVCLRPVYVQDFVVFQTELPGASLPNTAVVGCIASFFNGQPFEAVHARCLDRGVLLSAPHVLDPARCAVCGLLPVAQDVIVPTFVVADIKQSSRESSYPQMGLRTDTPLWTHLRCSNPRGSDPQDTTVACPDCRRLLPARSWGVLATRIRWVDFGLGVHQDDFQAHIAHARCTPTKCPLFL